MAQRMVVCQAYAIPSFDPFDPFDKLPGTMPGTGRTGRLRTRRSGQARRGKKLEVGGALRLRLEAKTSRQTTDDRGQRAESELRIAECGLRNAEGIEQRA